VSGRAAWRWAGAFAGAACVAASVAACALYLPHAGLWLDETAQLAGLTLNPIDQARWLADWSKQDLGVPDDRMPPLSYWVDWGWTKVFGLREVPLRWLGVIETALSTLLIFATARRAWGLAAALAAGLLFALAPSVVVIAVEIRAYPLFMLAAAAAFYCLVRYAEDPAGGARSWLPALAACALVAVYTHFFGLVLGGGLFVAALGCAAARRAPLGPVVAAGLIAGLLSLGVLPFVAASFARSRPVDSDTGELRLMGLVRLGYRLFAHASLTVWPAVLIVAAIGALLAGTAALAPKRRTHGTGSAILAAWAAGALVVAMGQFTLQGMQAAAATYNVWMLPALALVLGSGLAAASQAARALAAVGIVALAAAYLCGDAQLAAHGDVFAHTPHHAVDALVQRLGGPASVAVVFDGANTDNWHIYTPFRYEYSGSLHQVVAEPGERGALRLKEFSNGRPAGDLTALFNHYLIVVRPRSRTAAELARQIRDGVVSPVGDGPVATALKSDGRYRLVEEATFPAFVTADVDVFQRLGTD
jgi:hypothetical protein